MGKRRKTKTEIFINTLFYHIFPETIYQNKAHEGLQNLLMFADYLFLEFVENLFDQVKLKCPYSPEDFQIIPTCGDSLGVVIQFLKHDCAQIQRIYVRFQPPTETDSAIRDVAYYFVIKEIDGTLSCCYVDENIKIQPCCENVSDFDFVEDVVDDHYFEKYLSL